MWKKKLTPLRPIWSAILPFSNPLITPPMVTIDPKTEYCTMQKKCKINNKIYWQLLGSKQPDIELWRTIKIAFVTKLYILV